MVSQGVILGHVKLLHPLPITHRTQVQVQPAPPRKSHQGKHKFEPTGGRGIEDGRWWTDGHGMWHVGQEWGPGAGITREEQVCRVGAAAWWVEEDGSCMHPLPSQEAPSLPGPLVSQGEISSPSPCPCTVTQQPAKLARSETV